jgi:hypothetical protein
MTDPVRQSLSRPARQPVFLARPRYRQRRLMDAARFLPLIGIFAFLVPLLWPLPQDPAIAAGSAEPVAMSDAMTYLFAVWAGLIAAAMLLSLAARRWPAFDSPHGPRGEAREE